LRSVASLLESALFGYAGAFTGAQQNKLGKIELALASFLFLDQVGGMSLSARATLRRVLQAGIPGAGWHPSAEDERQADRGNPRRSARRGGMRECGNSGCDARASQIRACPRWCRGGLRGNGSRFCSTTSWACGGTFVNVS
jgi:hypothetical protein